MNDKDKSALSLKWISEALRRMREHRGGLADAICIIGRYDKESPLSGILGAIVDLNPIEANMALLRQEVEAMLAVIGVDSVAEISADTVSSDVAQDVGERMIQICHIGTKVRMQLKNQIVEGDYIQDVPADLAAFYSEEYKPHHDKMWDALLLFMRDEKIKEMMWLASVNKISTVLSGDEIKDILGRDPNASDDGVVSLTVPEWEKLSSKAIGKETEKNAVGIKHVFQTAISLLNENYENAGAYYLQGYEGDIHKTHFVDATLLAASDDFRPDDWIKNIHDVGPVFSSREKKEFPAHIRLRVDEMYRSFVFGNWMSVVALGRSLLEYMILDRGPRLGIEVYEKYGKERPKKISNLVDLTAGTDRAKSLEQDMRDIVEYGNDVMHPKRARKVKMYPSTRAHALDCMKKTLKIIQILYDKKK